jgi:hypothetical protein
MKKLWLLTVFLLAGCVTDKIIPSFIFPTPPAPLMVAPQDMKQIPVPAKEPDKKTTGEASG